MDQISEPRASSDLGNLDWTQAHKRQILLWPHPTLTSKAEAVEKFDEELKALVGDMLKTMYHAPGIGLAAPQVGVLKRVIVVDTQFEREVDDLGNPIFKKTKPLVLINPEVNQASGSFTYQEGCLSLPGIFEDITRAQTIELSYWDLDGSQNSLQAQDLLSICIQHEIDHLNGIMFTDYLSSFKQRLYRSKMLKEKKRLGLV